MHIPTLCDWLSVLSLLLATPMTQFSLDHKRQSHKQNQNVVFKLYTSDYATDSDSVLIENQP